VPPTTLILTQTGDTHAYAVEIGLRQQGTQVLLWHTSDFPSRTTESVHFGADGTERIWLHGVSEHDIAEKRISSVWRRRPAYMLDRENLHPADRVFSDWQCRAWNQLAFAPAR
jgi:hypothetical protein